MERHLSARLGIRCVEHPGQKPEYFCCGKLICSLCYENHSSHDSLTDLQRKSIELKQSVPELLKQLDEKQSHIERRVRHNESLLRKNKTEMQKNRERIHKRTKEIINYLKEKETCLKQDCIQRHDQVGNILNQIIQQHSKLLSELKIIQEKCEQLSSYESVTETVRVGVKLTQQIETFSCTVNCPEPQIPEFIPPESLPSRDYLRRIIGTVNDGLDMDSDWTTDESEKFKIEKKFKWKHKNVGIAPLDTDSAWIYTIDRGDSIHLISQNGDIIKEILNYKHRKIEKIFTTRLKNAWVTDLEKCSVKVLRHSGELQHKFSLAPFHPFGICPTRCGHYVWICLADKSSFIPELKGRTKVVKMTIQGYEICAIECQNEKPFFTFPYRCAENMNEDICVVDKISETRGQVYIFNREGLPKCGYIGTTVEKDFDPRDICCNSRENIIISDSTNNAIHILSHDGILQKLLNMEFRDFKQPITVATDTNDRVWISFYDGNIIIIRF